jgi:hypothetical protein
MCRPAIAAALLLAASACAPPPMRWEKSGADPNRDEAACRAGAHEEAIRRMPYGNGPPIFGYPQMSMLQWTQGIDIQRSYLEEDLVRACMRERGYALVPGK